MSRETTEWLNTMTLIGFTDKRGKAWHYREESQGNEPNHYPGAIPMADVERRLFYWVPTKGDVTIAYRDNHGNVVTIVDPTRTAIVNPEDGYVFGIHGVDYQIHDYREWLIGNIGLILDDDLAIASAGLLKGGGVAWVQVEMPENVMTPEGVEFRTFLQGSSSLDGSLASNYGTGVQMIVCDNTLSAANANAMTAYKVKHTANSLGRINDAREALQIVYKTTANFEAEVARLTRVDVTDKQWASFLDFTVPFPEEDGRGMTMAENKRAQLNHLWVRDERVSPWKNTAFGVVQAVNTWTHHFAIVRKASRAERNAQRSVMGGVDKLDGDTLKALSVVIDNKELVTV